jgi:hypothetical protein
VSLGAIRLKTAGKSLRVRLIAFATISGITAWLTQYLPTEARFSVFGVFAGLFAFMALTCANLPIEHFQRRYGTGAYPRFVKTVCTCLLALTAFLFFLAFSLVLLIKIGRTH